MGHGANWPRGRRSSGKLVMLRSIQVLVMIGALAPSATDVPDRSASVTGRTRRGYPSWREEVGTSREEGAREAPANRPRRALTPGRHIAITAGPPSKERQPGRTG